MRGGGGGRGGKGGGPEDNTYLPPSSNAQAAVIASAAVAAAANTVTWVTKLWDSADGRYRVGSSTLDLLVGNWIVFLVVAFILQRAKMAADRSAAAGGETSPLLSPESGGGGASGDPSQSGVPLSMPVLVFTCLFLPKCVVWGWDFGGEKGEKTAATAMMIVSAAAVLVQWGFVRKASGGVRKNVPSASAVRVILKPYFAPRGGWNKVRAAATWLCIICAKVCSIYTPLLMGKIVTKLGESTLPLSTTSLPLGLIALYCGLVIGAKIFKEAQAVLYVKVKQAAFIEMVDTVFQHVHMLSLEWNLRKKMGNVVRAIDRGSSSADNIVSYLFIYLLPTLLEAIVTFVIFYTHFQQPAIAAVFLLCFSVFFVVTFYVTGLRRQFREGMNQHDNDYHNKITESLVNFEMVKYFAAEERERAGVRESVSHYQRFGVVIQATLSGLNISQQLCIVGCQFGVMILAGSAVVNHETKPGGSAFGVGDFVATLAYVTQLFTPLTFLGSVYNTVVMGFVNMQHLAELLAERPDIVDKPTAKPLVLAGHPGSAEQSGAEVSFENIDFRYPSADAGAGLSNITFRVPAGKKVAIVGPTGSGKTTLSRLLFRFYELNAGRICINGQDIADTTQQSLRGAIGIVPQDTVLFNSTIRQNVMYGRPSATEDEMLKAARDAQLDTVIDKLPNGWDTIVGERGLRLSGGEKQRVAIARCLLKNPPVIVLDEATSALDSSTEKEIIEVLQCLRGRTMLVVAHRLSTIQDADVIVVLKGGKIVESGTHESLRRANGVYDELWSNQETKKYSSEDGKDADDEEIVEEPSQTKEPARVEGGSSGAIN